MARRGVHGKEQFRMVRDGIVYAFMADDKVLRQKPFGYGWKIAKLKAEAGETARSKEAFLASKGFSKTTEKEHHAAMRQDRKAAADAPRDPIGEAFDRMRAGQKDEEKRLALLDENFEALSHVKLVANHFGVGAHEAKTDYTLVAADEDACARIVFEDGWTVFLKAERTK